MHEAALARAALPAPTVVLGMLLRPFSIGHYLWLVRSQILTIDSENLPVRALPQAVFICCQGWRENLANQSDHWLPLKLRIWNWRTRKHDLLEGVRQFRKYLEEGSLEFPLSDMPRADAMPSRRRSGSPFCLVLQQWLMTHLGLSEAAAWDYPFGLAKMRWAAHWEGEGGLDVYNWHDSEFERYVLEQEKKAAAAG